MPRAPTLLLMLPILGMFTSMGVYIVLATGYKILVVI